MSLNQISQTGYRGGRLPMHRAFRTLSFSRRQWLVGFAQTAAFVALVVFAYSHMLVFWEFALRFWFSKLALSAELVHLPLAIGWGITLDRLAIVLDAASPTNAQLAWHAMVVLIVFGATFLLRAALLPVAYLLRGLCAVHLVAIGFFLVASAAFPYEVLDHTRDLFGFSVCIIFLAPVVMGATLFIFEHSWWRRLMGMFVVTGYFALSLPITLLAHAIAAHFLTALVMPLLTLVFGPLLDVLMLVGLYSWLVSLRPEAEPPPRLI